MTNIIANDIFSIYLLYPMDRDDEDNFYKLLQNYINVGTEIYAYLLDWEKMDGFPKFRLYVPADHEVFIHSAYKSGFINKEQIRNINCRIIEKCDLVILYDGWGLEIDEELSYAKQEKIAVYSMPDLSPHAIQSLRLAIKLTLKSDNSDDENCEELS